jgi:hypothetical protein
MPEWHTGFDGFKEFPLSRGRERLESFLRLSGWPAYAPLNPLRQATTLRLETSQDFRARSERASRCGLSSRYSETRSRSLDPLIRVLKQVQLSQLDEFRILVFGQKFGLLKQVKSQIVGLNTLILLDIMITFEYHLFHGKSETIPYKF